jgi:hypothetical protein
MAAVTGLGAASALRGFRWGIGFETKDLFLQAVNDLLLFQTLWAAG